MSSRPSPPPLILSPIQRSQKMTNPSKKRSSVQNKMLSSSLKLSLREKSNDSDLEPYHQYLDKWSPENSKFFSTERTQPSKPNVDIERFITMRKKNNTDHTQRIQQISTDMIKSKKDRAKLIYDTVSLSGETVFDVCSVPRENRNQHDGMFVAEYMNQQVKYFSKMDINLVIFLGKKLCANRYNAGDPIIIKGEIGDCMYIIFKGTVEVKIPNHKGPPIYIGTNAVFGQTALQNKEKRNADVYAKTNVELLTLFKTDYDSVVFEFRKIQKQK